MILFWISFWIKFTGFTLHSLISTPSFTLRTILNIIVQIMIYLLFSFHSSFSYDGSFYYLIRFYSQISMLFSH